MGNTKLFCEMTPLGIFDDKVPSEAGVLNFGKSSNMPPKNWQKMKKSLMFNLPLLFNLPVNFQNPGFGYAIRDYLSSW